MFNRQVVKSETATIRIPELDFGFLLRLNTDLCQLVEGILVIAADELEALQEERKKVDPQTAEAIDEFLIQLRACATGHSPFTFILDDPAGNSFIENPSEVKPGGRIPDKGKKIIVRVKNIKDLTRDVIKSDTACVNIPELELELTSGTFGGLVTTVKGLISKIGEKNNEG